MPVTPQRETVPIIRLSLGAALVLSAFGAQAQQAIPLSACDAPHQTVLQAAAANYDARAIWLDRKLLKWPGADTAATYKLYHSVAGAINAPAGGKVSGADGSVALERHTGAVKADVAQRFKYVADGAVLSLPAGAPVADLLKQQLVLVQQGPDGTVIDATTLQAAGALDDLYAAAESVMDLGASPARGATRFKLWAPTAHNVAVCTYDNGYARAAAIEPMRFDAATGVWSASRHADLSGKYYKYVVDVNVPNAGLVRNLVTDPYSVSLTTDSQRSYIADLDSPRLKPAGWDKAPAPKKVAAPTDLTVYELHVRDFSISDATVSAANRGKYTAFTETRSNGMKHLAALSQAGMTDIHFLPVYDIGSVPEKGCAMPQPSALKGNAADSDSQQALVGKTRHTDCYNWGYDPFHYSAPEGSYATDAADGARRIVEFRQMVMALHKTGLRVGMDVVYNHTYRAGQDAQSVLDRIVPGYYHRLSDKGAIESSTCCFNTATENRMMAKLMIDSTALWTRHYKIDSFRFDLMGHQPRAAMEALQARVDKAAGRHVHLIGEGWNFGEVENGKRFVQASQLSLNGSAIGTFSDRGRDAVRGGGAGDSGKDMFARQGYINGLVYDPNAQAPQRPKEDLLRAADLVRVGLAGTLRSYPLTTYKDQATELQAIDYAGQPAGYASEPSEVVNYVENHDNQTLYDANALKLPLATTSLERARVQVLGAAINAFSQGVAYFHAGQDILRSKSLDRNSFESGDWFNRLDWSYQDNYFGTGLPPQEDNGKDYALLKPVLANAAIKPTPADIAFSRDAFRDLLKIRSGSSLFRMRTASDIRQRLHFFNTGSSQVPTVIAARIDGAGYPGAGFKTVTYLINVDKVEQSVVAESEKGKRYKLHPVQAAHGAADARAKEARYDAASGKFTVPARTAVVFVE
ncbi:pullulanase-type alpha-1,6-glucosidase [Duganella sp. FT92W]|uniref:Pullulanase-type alpha-1,6-glucosidase n=1 Tax=Pseudoduganella rivuli TaxID=2666085 RepID=A0A7X2LSY5_9BURK|nr:pullulanase-type alpha-1,6-glucosidase [Pseudoduganella rivuli]MRV71249.1 pullulanase-type alpha-1,6-glucosidase [Pseudoduganella rivuli]